MQLRRISIPGAILALLYLLAAVAILILSADCRGEGCVLQLFVTFPWFFIFLGGGGTALMYIVSLSLNAAIWYGIGLGLEKLARKLLRSRR